MAERTSEQGLERLASQLKERRPGPFDAKMEERRAGVCGASALERLLEGNLREGRFELPLLPAVAAQVMALTNNNDVDARKLAEVIQRDQAMGAHLLRIANSPLYRGRCAMPSLQQAISRLGLRQVRQVGISIACQTRIFRVRGYEEEVASLFRHSFATALFASELARSARANSEEAFLAGLLHDVGKPILLQAIVDLTRISALQVERRVVLEVVDALHARWGEALAHNWNLPSYLGESIAFHHDPERAPSSGGLAMLTNYADFLAHATVELPFQEAPALGHRALAHLRLPADEVRTLLSRRAAIVSTAAAA